MGASQAQVLMFAHAHVEAKRFPARSHHKHQVKSADLTRYPEDIAQALLNTREVPLAGPGLARTQFRDGCVQYRAAVAEVVVDSVAADHPTDAQLLAIACQYFKKFDNMVADPATAA